MTPLNPFAVGTDSFDLQELRMTRAKLANNIKVY
jgi:hypothetical protein